MTNNMMRILLVLRDRENILDTRIGGIYTKNFCVETHTYNEIDVKNIKKVRSLDFVLN